MTIKAAASAIIDDLVESGSFLRTQVSACDYGILDTAGGCAVVVQPGNSDFEPYLAFGGVYEARYGMVVQGFVRDRGDVTETLTGVWDIQDALLGAINGGSNANNSQYSTRVHSINHTPNVSWVSPGGNDFALVTANAITKEDP